MRYFLTIFALLIATFGFGQNNPSIPMHQEKDFTVFTIKKTDSLTFSKQSTTSKDIALVVNGPLYNKENKIIGGYVQNEIQIQPWLDSNVLPKRDRGNYAPDNGIFGKTISGEMILVRYENRKILSGTDRLQWGFQNGRILIERNKILNIYSPNSKNLYTRSGIGFTMQGEIIIAVSNKPVRYYDLARCLQNNGCIQAIYLDGADPVGYCYGLISESKTNRGIFKTISQQQNGLLKAAPKLQFSYGRHITYDSFYCTFFLSY